MPIKTYIVYEIYETVVEINTDEIDISKHHRGTSVIDCIRAQAVKPKDGFGTERIYNRHFEKGKEPMVLRLSKNIDLFLRRCGVKKV